MAKSRGTEGSVSGKSRSVTTDLAKRIATARGSGSGGGSSASGAKSEKVPGHARAARLGTEFIAAILVGAGMGYVLDLALGTSPWLMLVMLLVGFGAGILNVVRGAAEMNAENPAPLDADVGPAIEDDDDR